RLIAAGAKVLGVSRTPAGIPGDDAFVQIECDLLSPEAPEIVLHGALDAFGRVDALVNNAGVLIEGACWEQTDAELDAMVELNLSAPFRLSQRFAAHWVTQRAGGVIVNVCSVESQVAWTTPPQAAYATTKGGLLGLTRAMALELAPQGIRVVAVGPGVIATAMTPDTEKTDAIPLGHRFGAPEEIGELTAFLISDAASYITGEIVYADGGYLLT
ncbi:MAG TPA: SDR family oxidoreductase, partial [Solirubrobacteraceae bacterium]|nr:SDR family oxidoreductase [Solirubrobacteraceae bacterium]